MKTRQHGIALLEAMLATLILAIGLLGTIGMQARAYSAMAGAGARAEATIATEKLLGAMASDQANLALYALAAGAAPGQRLQSWYEETRLAIPAASIVVTVTPVAATSRTEVVVSISWTRKKNEPQYTNSVTAYIAQSS
ncbi:hypothetical protein [Janthinobacterium sp.]|uniref:type IV pilus modification PilV family protein n=1 Tax=Janthinobacterium sp. TaxID=1871054 RepID=UPI00293D880F|nr:hypothetical protein [Janthinobacterium sp.]